MFPIKIEIIVSIKHFTNQTTTNLPTSTELLPTYTMASTPVITYVSDAVLTSRLQTIYKAIANGHKAKALDVSRDTLVLLQNCMETDMTPGDRNAAIGVFYKALVELAFNRYQTAHDLMRQLYYKIQADYLEDYVLVTV